MATWFGAGKVPSIKTYPASFRKLARKPLPIPGNRVPDLSWATKIIGVVLVTCIQILKTAPAISSRADLALDVLITTSNKDSANGFFSKGSEINTVTGWVGIAKGSTPIVCSMAIIETMTHLTSLLPSSPLSFLNPETLLTAAGQWAFVVVLVIVFAECGLLVGFFLPGDSLLFATGLFIATGLIDVPLWLALILIPIAAIMGNLVGYWVGYRVGPTLFRKEDSRIFKKEYVEKTSEFFNEYGNRAIIMARFVPIVRTFITAMAGVAKMNYRDYALYSVVGGIIWGTGLTWLGALLGKIEFVANNIELMAIAIIIISFIPVFMERRKMKKKA